MAWTRGAGTRGGHVLGTAGPDAPSIPQSLSPTVTTPPTRYAAVHLTPRPQEFAAVTIAEQKEAGAAAPLPSLRLSLPFDEAALWRDNGEFVRKALDVARVRVVDVSTDAAAAAEDPTGRAKDAVPGEPVVWGFAAATEV